MKKLPTVASFSLVALFIGLAVNVSGGTTSPQLPDSVQSKRVAAFLNAFNSTEDGVLRKCLTEHYAASSLASRPIDARISSLRTMQGDLRPLTLHQVLSVNPTEVVILARSGKEGWVEMGFRFELEPPNKIAGIRFEESVSPEERAASPKTMAELIPAVEKHIEAAVKADEFSGTVLIARGDKVIFEKAYGLASREYQVPNRIDTRFNLGSINKVFTRLAIAQLVEKGQLSPADTIGKILPDYPNPQAAAKVTVQHLLNMSSGIGDFFGKRFADTPKDRIRTISDYLPLFASEPLLFEPGASERYSNGGYVVLGAIIEKMSGQDYYTYVREHIFVPAGMTSSDSFEADVPTPNVASGYSREDGGSGKPGPWRNNMYTRPARGSSAGGGYSTVADLYRFGQALQGGKLLSAVSMMRFFPQLTQTPAGQGPAPGMAVAGGAPGINAALEIDPPSKTTVVVMANLDPPAAGNIARTITRWLRNIRE